MNRGKSLSCAVLVVVCTLVFTVPASAHSVFKKQLAAKYRTDQSVATLATARARKTGTFMDVFSRVNLIRSR